jgi:hypothetical protein
LIVVLRQREGDSGLLMKAGRIWRHEVRLASTGAGVTTKDRLPELVVTTTDDRAQGLFLVRLTPEDDQRTFCLTESDRDQRVSSLTG